MGVQGLWKLLECTRQPINPETLEGKILAVDISIWLNQAVKGARDRHGNAIHNAHLLTLFHRLCKLLFHRIRPIFVFDGKAPLLKKQTLANRRQRKELATRESKKTTDKLLKTILKRQALKNALGSKSEEIVPSLSQVRKEEIDDIYVLPPLEKKEENSSDEEAEKEWEERVNNRKLLQNEFLENPHSIDIESEDFASLPPEMRHEILSDLKEFTKRQRTLIYSMPEESTDFSQYQLTGLLKRNKLNQHIEGIQKEMNEQYSGQIQLQYNKEGGFVKDVETRRLVSEDSTHYILLKGLKSKNTENEEPAAKATTSDNDGSVAAAAPPSPRTLIAIQAAMLESSSDEETESTENKLLFRNQDWPQHSTNVAATNMNVSPRTYRAIQDALEDDEITTETGWDSLNKCNSSRKRPALSSSSEDDSENKLLKTSVNAQNSSSEQTISQTVGLKDQSCVEPKEGSITSSQNTLTKVENQSASSVASNAVDTVKIEQNIQELDFQSLEVIKKPEDPDLINSTDGQTSFSNGEYIHLREKVLSSESKNANNAASPKPPFPITPVPTQAMIEETEENAWDDIDLEEIEALEDNLFVEQSNLQTQKRRQEQMAATVTGQMYLESQELLRLFGVPYIVAPMEAEAQCAFLDMTDQTNGTITDDSDVWLFGARHVYKNFFSQDKYVEYYQYVHIHNQLGLDRTKLINLAYLLGSDYTEGIATVGYVTGMELLNEFLGPGQQPLIQDWWNEAQNNKRLQSNPNDTKVKKKLRELKISPGFPNAAVAEAYLKPSVDESKELLSWGKPDLDQIREYPFFRWNKTKIDDILLPIIKKLNVHQTQQRIDTFFRVERHEQQAIKSQRLRRAVTCILRKDREETLAEVQEATAAMGEATKCTGQKRGGEQAMAIQERASGSQSQTRKRQKPQKSPQGLCSGGFIGSASLAEAPPSEDEVEVEATNSKRLGLNARSLEKQMKGRENKNDNTAVDMSSSSGDEEDEGAAKMITARSVFGKRGKLKGARGNPRKKR
uniref:DNA repair protein complementing XP-G cells n=1 Tax=Callorhinchus milii TaxID=7868 RepID=A0A4W3H6I7_CALMI